MSGSRTTFLIAGLLLAGCASADEKTVSAGPAADSALAGRAVACAPQTSRMPLAGRASPYDSVAIPLGATRALVCYGRPSLRGRAAFGALIPYGQIWRTGANEPTTIHLPVAGTIAGIAVPAGTYSLYTLPGEREWTVIVNRATSQWGIEAQYTAEVQAQEVGRATVPAEPADTPVETFTLRAEPSAAGADLLMEWEKTRVRIPVTPG